MGITDSDLTDGFPDKTPGLGPSEADSIRVLLVDDDPIFGKIMGRVAEQARVRLTYCQSLHDFSLIRNWKFDVAIVDYDLGETTGLEISKQLQKNVIPLPVILVSQSQMVETPMSRWPKAVKGFMQKGLGHFAIMEAALAAHENAVVQFEGAG